MTKFQKAEIVYWDSIPDMPMLQKPILVIILTYTSGYAVEIPCFDIIFFSDKEEEIESTAHAWIQSDYDMYVKGPIERLAPDAVSLRETFIEYFGEESV